MRDAVGQNQAQGATGERLLSVSGISKQFGATRALDGVTLTFNAGEALALLGESGAGKSALIKLLANVHALDSGRIVDQGDEARGLADPSIENLLAAAANANARSPLYSGVTHANDQV